MFDFFHGTIFLMGDVTKVATVRKFEEKKEVKLQRRSPTKNTKQRWILRFERDRVLGKSPSALQPAAAYTTHALWEISPISKFHQYTNETTHAFKQTSIVSNFHSNTHKSITSKTTIIAI